MKALSTPIFILLFAQFVAGQKIVKKAIVNPNKQYIQLDTKNCYLVELSTSKNKELSIEASIEGEYTKDLVVRVEEDGLNVLVSADFLPNFIAPNDKLSAHKVISIALKVVVPEYSNVNIYGTNSQVVAEGNYINLAISLANGDCILDNVRENIVVKTQKGNIKVTVNEGIIEAESIYGSVIMPKLLMGDTSYKLTSVEGNIYINKTE